LTYFLSLLTTRRVGCPFSLLLRYFFSYDCLTCAFAYGDSSSIDIMKKKLFHLNILILYFFMRYCISICYMINHPQIIVLIWFCVFQKLGSPDFRIPFYIFGWFDSPPAFIILTSVFLLLPL